MAIAEAISRLRGAFGETDLTQERREALTNAVSELETADALQESFKAAHEEARRRGNTKDTYNDAPDGYWEGWNAANEWITTRGQEDYRQFLPVAGPGKL